MPKQNVSLRMLAAGFLLGTGLAQASLSGYNFTTIDDPSAQYFPQTIAVGLNNAGSIVGYYSTSSSGYNGFLYTGGTFSNLSDTYEQLGNEINSTYAYGINDSGVVVGTYKNFFGTDGFVYSGGTFTNVTDPGTFDTYAVGINNSGMIVGYAYNGTIYTGFLDNGGTFTSISDPDAGTAYGEGTFVTGINTSGVVVGYYIDSTGTAHGFMEQSGVFTNLTDPNAGTGTNEGTYAFGINDQGQIAGYYVVSGTPPDLGLDYHGFIYDSGSYTTIDDPDALATGGTQIYGINNAGDIVGQYTCSTCGDNYQGFYATPESSTPEPQTVTLLFIGLLMGLLMIKFSHRAHGYKRSSGAARPRGN